MIAYGALSASIDMLKAHSTAFGAIGDNITTPPPTVISQSMSLSAHLFRATSSMDLWILDSRLSAAWHPTVGRLFSDKAISYQLHEVWMQASLDSVFSS